MLGIDRIQFAAESASEQVAKHQGADSVGFLAGTEYGDGVWREESVEIMLSHFQVVLGVPRWHNLTPTLALSE